VGLCESKKKKKGIARKAAKASGRQTGKKQDSRSGPQFLCASASLREKKKKE
jgi:hypothetical protein